MKTKSFARSRSSYQSLKLFVNDKRIFGIIANEILLTSLSKQDFSKWLEQKRNDFLSVMDHGVLH